MPIEAAVAVPRGISLPQAAGIGLPYLTAWEVRSAAVLLPGETILVLGALGSVGGAVARLAHRAGARVIGVARTLKDVAAGATVPVDAWIDLASTGLAAGCRALTGGRGADVVFDPVGGDLFEPCLAALARRGRQVTIASGGKPRVAFNLVDFYHNESRLIGVDSLKASFAHAGQVLGEFDPRLRKWSAACARSGSLAARGGAGDLPPDRRWHAAQENRPGAVRGPRPRSAHRI